MSPPPKPQSWAGEYIPRRSGANPQIPQGWAPSPPFNRTNRRDSTNHNGLDRRPRSWRDMSASPTSRGEDYLKYFSGNDVDNQPMGKKEMYENINSWIKDLDKHDKREQEWKNRLQSTPSNSMLIGQNGELEPFPFDPHVEDIRATYLRNKKYPRPSPPNYSYGR